MALTDENGGGIPATMLVSPTNGCYGQNSGMGGFGDNGWWVILLIIIFACFGGNCGGNGGFGGGSMPVVISDNNGGAVQRGFDQSAIMSGVGNIQNGISGLSTQLCNCCCDIQGTVNNGFYGVQTALCNGFNGVEQGANARQMANMQQMFANQTATTQGFTNLASQFADCCCENRLATERLNYTIATENCADRTAAAQNTRDIIENNNRNNQLILDKLCRLELDAKNDRISELERQLTAANLSASQIAQTAQIQQTQNGLTDALYARLRDCPVPSMPVYGMQPIFTCNANNGNTCGCGCN